MAIVSTSAVRLTQTFTNRAFVAVDLGATSQSDPTITVGKANVTVLAGSLAADGSYTAGPITVNTTALPSSLGPKTGALSLSVVPNTDTPFPVVGNIASGVTDSGNPVKTAGVVKNSFQVQLTVGNRQDLILGRTGLVGTSCLFAGTVSDGINNAFAMEQISDTGSAAFPVQGGLIFNPSGTWDRMKKGGVLSRIASTAAGGSPTVAKASAGDAQQFWGQNGGAITYLQFYNSATTPVVGTTTIVATYPIAATAQFNQTIPNSLYFSAGVAFAFTTDVAGTTAAAAAAVTSFALFGA